MHILSFRKEAVERSDHGCTAITITKTVSRLRKAWTATGGLQTMVGDEIFCVLSRHSACLLAGIELALQRQRISRRGPAMLADIPNGGSPMSMRWTSRRAQES